MSGERILSDKVHKQIIARYAECNNMSKVAREFGVSVMTVKRHLEKDKESLDIVNRKKEQNTLDMLAYFDSRKANAQDLLDRIMEAMSDPEKVMRANYRDLATAYGIIADKFTQITPEQNTKANVLLEEIRQGITEGKKYVE